MQTHVLRFTTALSIMCMITLSMNAQQGLVLLSPLNGVASMKAEVGATASTQIVFTNVSFLTGSVSISGFNRTEFTGSADSVIALDVADTAAYTVTFSPTAQGNILDTIIISGNLGTIYVVLNGTGLSSAADGSFTLSTNALDFNPIVINTTAESNVVITNTSSAQETITANLILDSEFSLSTPSSFNLQAGESATIKVDFSPTAAAEFSDSLVISSGLVTKSLLVNGNGIESNDTIRTFILSSGSIDFGSVLVGSKTTGQTSIISTSTATQNIQLRLVNGTNFSIISNDKFTLGALSTITINVEYTPAAEGDDTDTLIVTDGSAYIYVSLRGTASTTPFLGWQLTPAIVTFGPAKTNTVVTSAITIENLSSTAIVIDSAIIAGQDAAEFEITSSQAFPFTVAANASAEIAISTTMRDSMNSTIAWITVSAEGRSKQAILVQVFDAASVRDTVRVRCENTRGTIGGTARVVVTLLSDLPQEVVRGEITYEFNASVMVPIRVPLTSIIFDGQRQVTFSFTPESTAEGEVMTSEMFTLTLGDAESTPVKITSLKLFNSSGRELNTETISNDALVSVDDAGGRTVNANSAGLSLKLTPNPAVNNVTATFKSTAFPSGLAVYNSMGVLVADATAMLPQSTEGEVGISLQAFASGTYLVRFSSGTSTIVRTLVKY
ncbi:MAG: choice-of-anchor D domain-containing protein [Ignavibacteria bacterium]|nr:choice-of-anchor D domain-containing protein [Ignavibacteria bacterium]